MRGKASPYLRDGRQGSPMTVSEFPFFHPGSPSSRCVSPSSASVASSDSFSRSLTSRFPPAPRPVSPDVGTYDIQRFPQITSGYNREICSRDGSNFDFNLPASRGRNRGSACFRNSGRSLLLDDNYAVCASPIARDRKSFNTEQLLDTISFKNSALRSRKQERKKGFNRKSQKSTRQNIESGNRINTIRVDKREEMLDRLERENDILSVRELPFY